MSDLFLLSLSNLIGMAPTIPTPAIVLHIFLLILIPSISTVTISLKHWHTDHKITNAFCHNIPPGVCCIPPIDVVVPVSDIAASQITVFNLEFQQLGFGFGRKPPAFLAWDDCVGNPLITFHGPFAAFTDYLPSPVPWREYLPPDGPVSYEWHPDIPGTWDVWDTDYREGSPWLSSPEGSIFSASWVDLRTKVPPETDELKKYLQSQGVKGLVAGDAKWSPVINGEPHYRRSQGLRKRADWQHQRIVEGALPSGTVYLSSTGRWQYADLIIVNGTNYTDERKGNGIYTSANGTVLSFGKPANSTN